MRVDFISGDDDELGEVCWCPTCEKPWLVLAEEDVDYPEECSHLRFVLPPDADLDGGLFRNGMSQAGLTEAIAKAYGQAFPDGEAEQAFSMLGELIGCEDDDEEAEASREKVDLEGVDTVVVFTQGSPMTGYFTSIFGATLGKHKG